MGAGRPGLGLRIAPGRHAAAHHLIRVFDRQVDLGIEDPSLFPRLGVQCDDAIEGRAEVEDPLDEQRRDLGGNLTLHPRPGQISGSVGPDLAQAMDVCGCDVVERAEVLAARVAGVVGPILRRLRHGCGGSRRFFAGLAIGGWQTRDDQAPQNRKSEGSAYRVGARCHAEGIPDGGAKRQPFRPSGVATAAASRSAASMTVGPSYTRGCSASVLKRFRSAHKLHIRISAKNPLKFSTRHGFKSRWDVGPRMHQASMRAPVESRPALLSPARGEPD
jgi:hypothetical protein